VFDGLLSLIIENNNEEMLTQTEWQKIKAELKKNIEPIFKRSDITFSVPFEQIIDVFQLIIEKEIGDNDLDDREKIGEALKIRYIIKDGNLYSTVLFTLAIKLETYFKRLYKIADEALWIGEHNLMKGQIVTFVKKQKHNYADVDFLSAQDVIAFDNPDKKFVKTYSSTDKTPVYSPEDLRGLFPFSEQFKWAYDIANSQRHSDPSVSEDDLPKLITYVITCYLYVASKYSKKLTKELIHESDIIGVSNWGIFRQYCGDFQKNQSYFLVIDRPNLTKEQLSHFANIKWEFVFDFDTNSENNGLYDTLNSLGYFPQSIHQIIHTTDDRGKITATFPNNTTFWYFTQGSVGRQKSLLQSSKIADWKTMYVRYSQDLMIEFYQKKYSFSHNPIKVIILSKDGERIKEIAYAIKGMNPNLNIEFVFANEDNSKLLTIIDEISAKKIDLPSSTLIEGLRELKGVMFPSNSGNEVYLPCHSKNGISILLPNIDVLSIKQFFQIIHLGILNEEQEQVSDKTFYQGRMITWKELDNRIDVDRNITKDIKKALIDLLEKRSESEIVYLTHYAGVGGSTIARRIAFDIYTDFPVLFLNETISSYSETLLVEKLLKVFQATDLPTLVIVDNSNITRQQIEILEKVTGNRLAKTVFLLVESTFLEPRKEPNKFYIPTSLAKNEADRFVTRFSEKYPEKAKNFHFILTDYSINALNPFYFGLIANETEYISIDSYVSKRIGNITDKEKDLLKLLSFCQIFAKGKLREVPHFVISKFLEIDEVFIRLKSHTQNTRVHDLIIETDNLSWKTIHPIIAQSILKQTMGANEAGNVDVYALKEFAIALIKSLRTISDNRNEEVLELLHNLFVLRGDEDSSLENEEANTDYSDNLYDKKLFSKFINDLEYNNNRIEIFEALTTEFPDENAHFWGHFSRLYSINKDFSMAKETIDKALEIDADFIFYHIKGMCFRTELYRLKDLCGESKEEALKKSEQMTDYFEKAREVFQMAREIAPQKEHGYIAFIQMAMQMIEFEYSISVLKTPSKDYTQFIITNTWCRSLLTQANEVINDYKRNNQEFENPKIQEKQIQLLKFFGEKEKMVNAWNGLLGKNEFDQNSVRRQLAYALLAKNEFDWEQARGKDLNRIIEHIEENLKNKVEVRDLQLWFEAARRINTNVNEIIRKVEQWEFQKPSLDTAYYLMCLFGIQSISGVKSGIDNYEKYQKKVSDRINTTYSKVFCIEWAGNINNSAALINNKQVGKWVRDRQFFDRDPNNLLRLKGKVIKYLSRTQGFIEIENIGIQVMYQPALCNHFSDDAQKGTKVELYLGFNYDGARAFEVKND
jgi:hypothetical protein